MNTSTYRYAILFVGATLLLSVVGIVLLAFGDFGGGRPIPDVLQNIAIGSLTGLVGLLVQPGENDVPLLGKHKNEAGESGLYLLGVALVVLGVVLVLVDLLTVGTGYFVVGIVLALVGIGLVIFARR